MKKDLVINASIEGLLLIKYERFKKSWIYEVNTKGDWYSCDMCDAKHTACRAAREEFNYNLCYMVNHYMEPDFDITRNDSYKFIDESGAVRWYGIIPAPGGYLKEVFNGMSLYAIHYLKCRTNHGR